MESSRNIGTLGGVQVESTATCGGVSLTGLLYLLKTTTSSAGVGLRILVAVQQVLAKVPDGTRDTDRLCSCIGLNSRTNLG